MREGAAGFIPGNRRNHNRRKDSTAIWRLVRCLLRRLIYSFAPHRPHDGLMETNECQMAAKMATLKRGDVASQRHDSSMELSLKQAADTVGASVATTKRAKVVLTEGTPDERAALAGRAPLT